MIILQTKLNSPTWRENEVKRPEINDRFDHLLRKGTALVCAPPGYGKTTAAMQWLKDRKHSYCWVSLDSRDNDPRIFWRYIIAALNKQDERFSYGHLTGSYGYLESRDIQEDINSLLNELTDYSRTWKSPDQLVLILDDYHLITNAVIHEQFSYFLDYRPDFLKIIITSRDEPPLDLAIRRVRNELVDIFAKQLQFSFDHFQEFLISNLDVSLKEPQLRSLYNKTQGWIAVVQLAGLSLQHHPDQSQFVDQFTGKDTLLSSYLLEEIFNKLEPDLQDILLKISTVPRFCVSLCNEITRKQDGKVWLEALKQKKLLLISLDDDNHWFNLHDLFREWLVEKRSEWEPSQLLDIRVRAAHWFEKNKLYLEAIEQITETSNWLWASYVAGNIMSDLVNSGEFLTCQSLCNKFPAPFIRTQPKLCMMQAIVFYYSEQYDAALKILQRAETIFHQLQQTSEKVVNRDYGLKDDENIEALIIQGMIFRSTIARYTGTTESSPFVPHDGETGIIQGSSTISAWVQHEAGFQKFVNNQLGDAEPYLIKAFHSSLLERNLPCAFATFSWLTPTLYHQGKMESGLKLVNEFEEYLSKTEPQSSLFPAAVDYSKAVFYREQNKLEQAIESHNLAIEKSFKNADPLNRFYLKFQRLTLDLSCNDVEHAFKTLDEMEYIYHRYFSKWVFVIPSIEAFRAIIHLIAEDQRPLFDWAERFDKNRESRLAFCHEEEKVLYTKALLLQGRDIRDLTKETRQTAKNGNVRIREIKSWLVEAYYYGMQNQRINTMNAFRNALKIGVNTGLVRTFLDEGPQIKLLLETAVKLKIVNTYAKSLLNELNSPKSDSHVGKESHVTEFKTEPLSDRETDVLKLLNVGNSNSAIATELAIAESTVKTHVRNIYAKLGVNRRAQALASARRIGIL